MRMKKGIITISTIAVVILGVFFAVRFIGGRESVANVPEVNIDQTDKAIPKDNNEVLANDDAESTLNPTEKQKNVEPAKVESTKEMDTIYINDKTNVGIYTVQKNDTVFSIVNTYMPTSDKSETVKFIRDRNSINESYKIAEGQKIVIPYEKAIETVAGPEANNNEYMVKKQDTLTSIAKTNMPSYNVKHAIELLKEANKITDENSIKEGTLINIPKIMGM